MTGPGLVKKERCDGDHRDAFVVVTEPGRKAIEAAAPHHVAMLRRLFIDPLTPGKLEAITSAAENVLAVLDAETADGHHHGARREERPGK